MDRNDNCHNQRGWTSTFFDRTIAYLSADKKGKFELLSHARGAFMICVPFMMQQASSIRSSMSSCRSKRHRCHHAFMMQQASSIEACHFFEAV